MPETQDIAVVWRELLLAVGGVMLILGVALVVVKSLRTGILAIGLTVFALLACGFLYLAPREDIPMPRKSASPEQVVKAYIDAINARDFDTSNGIYPQDSKGFFSRRERIELKSIDRVEGDQRDHASVYFTAEFSGGDGSLDGRQQWGYELARKSEGHWFITGQGLV